ncbi:MAG TPA: response regulator [Anaerolineae bacterium]|nr:response regulator [Anaerolineae bacterium]
MNPTESPNSQPFHILLLEDLPEDARLIERMVMKAVPTYRLKVVNNRVDFQQALVSFDPTLILADYYLPQFKGNEALQIAQEQTPEIPFVFITGTLNDEELAAETILSGASGFVLKQNLGRLPEVITQALLDASNQREATRNLTQLQQEVDEQRRAIAQYQTNIAKMIHDMETLQAQLESVRSRDTLE